MTGVNPARCLHEMLNAENLGENDELAAATD
jgi:hypothetical protein